MDEKFYEEEMKNIVEQIMNKISRDEIEEEISELCDEITEVEAEIECCMMIYTLINTANQYFIKPQDYISCCRVCEKLSSLREKEHKLGFKKMQLCKLIDSIEYLKDLFWFN